VSLDEAAQRDFKTLGLEVRPPRIVRSPNPLLHVFLLLRNLNIHLCKSGLATATKAAIWVVRGKEHHFDYNVWSVTGLTIETVGALRDVSRHYTPRDLSRLVDWFNDQQQEWGAPHLLRLATRAYCEDLVEVAEEKAAVQT
jgi:hypothetical protein